jgi:hypothetical protein
MHFVCSGLKNLGQQAARLLRGWQRPAPRTLLSRASPEIILGFSARASEAIARLVLEPDTASVPRLTFRRMSGAPVGWTRRKACQAEPAARSTSAAETEICRSLGLIGEAGGVGALSISAGNSLAAPNDDSAVECAAISLATDALNR